MTECDYWAGVLSRDWVPLLREEHRQHRMGILPHQAGVLVAFLRLIPGQDHLPHVQEFNLNLANWRCYHETACLLTDGLWLAAIETWDYTNFCVACLNAHAALWDAWARLAGWMPTIEERASFDLLDGYIDKRAEIRGDCRWIGPSRN